MNYEFTSYIPEYCTNISDFGIYTNRGIMDIFNETSFLILETEISVFDEYSSQELISESAKEKTKEIINIIKKGFKNILESIKEFFMRIITFIKNLFNKAKQEVFSKATKGDFDNAVKFFNEYNGEEIKFTSESEDDNIFFAPKDFIKEIDGYNKIILYRANEIFKNLNNLYTLASARRDRGYLLGKQIIDKDITIQMLKYSTPSQVFGSILYGNGYDNRVSDTFGKNEIEEIIYNNLPKTTFLRNPINSSNLKNFANIIASTVYANDIQNKWVGITRSQYDQLKIMIEQAMKQADYFLYIEDDVYQAANDAIIDYNNKYIGSSQIDTNLIGPMHAKDYFNRCKDIITVLTSTTSVMDKMIADIYKKDIKLVCNIINKYYKLSKQKKEIIFTNSYTDSVPQLS